MMGFNDVNPCKCGSGNVGHVFTAKSVRVVCNDCQHKGPSVRVAKAEWSLAAKHAAADKATDKWNQFAEGSE